MARVSRLFVKLDVDLPDNEKIIRAGERAELLYIRGLQLLKKTLTDGFIAKAHVGRGHLSLAGVDSRVQALVREGLWEEVPDLEGGVRGYMVSGWLERNPTRQAIEELSDKRAAAARARGKQSAEHK